MSQVAVIVTDGRSDVPTQTIIQANFMKLADIKIVCVGIVERGDEGYQELRQIASDPEEVVRLQSDTFDGLYLKLQPLLAAACPPPPPPGMYAECFVPPSLRGALSQAAVCPSVCLSVCPVLLAQESCILQL